ncbi:hypothetical protein MMC28_010497 [Mycoblastus sanguinarius]|nr:hypothetical protein [Mycoblastus sanguinarius]
MWSELELLHSQFGPVVRIAPGEISICSAGAWKDIYTSRPLLPKEPSSQTPPLNGAHSLFTSVGNDHRRMRGILGAGFSDKALREQSPLIEHHVSELIKRLRRELESGPVIDVQRMFGYAALDTITDLGYGEPLGGLPGRSKHEWISNFFMHGRFSTVRMCLCYFSPLDKILDFVFLRLTRRRRAKNWAIFSSKIERRLAESKESRDRSDLITPVVDKVYDEEEFHTLNKDVKAKSLTKQELLSESLASVVANSQLTTVALTTCVYLLLRQEQAMHHLIREIRETFVKEEDINVQSSQPLLYLDAVIQETLRIHHPTPINLPRVVPPEGRNIDGIFVPGNTIVGINLHVIQTSQGYFLEPHTFHPERFLPASDARYESRFDQDVKTAYMPFSTGPRNCIGGK